MRIAVNELELSWHTGLTRRRAIRGLAGFLAGSPLLTSQQDPFRDHSRVPGIRIGHSLRFRTCRVREDPARGLRLYGAGRRRRVHVRRNREAFEWVGIIPKGVVDISSVQTATELLGTKLAFPILVAPSAGQSQLHPQGELAMHQGSTAAAETPMIVSNNASFPMDRSPKRPRDLYGFSSIHGSRSIPAVRSSSRRKRQAQKRSLLQSTSSLLLRTPNAQQTACQCRDGSPPDQHAGTAHRSAQSVQNRRHATWYDWTFIENIRPFVKVPLLIKGIVTPEDAKLCVDHGLNGIVVSNHGGRSLDYGPATLEVLPDIVHIVGGRIPVIIDSGFRRGSDIFKALALGAKAVCLGRVPRWDSRPMEPKARSVSLKSCRPS